VLLCVCVAGSRALSATLGIRPTNCAHGRHTHIKVPLRHAKRGRGSPRALQICARRSGACCRPTWRPRQAGRRPRRCPARRGCAPRRRRRRRPRLSGRSPSVRAYGPVCAGHRRRRTAARRLLRALASQPPRCADACPARPVRRRCARVPRPPRHRVFSPPARRLSARRSSAGAPAARHVRLHRDERGQPARRLVGAGHAERHGRARVALHGRRAHAERRRQRRRPGATAVH
jgi:hypothetical protein